MRSRFHDQLPASVRRSLQKFGADLGVARRKRRLTAAMMAERIGVATSTYARMENGDASVGVGAYAMALFVLGFGNALNELVDVRRDDHGLLLDQERIPKRVRAPRRPEGL
jgi:transcriptional regulator with XRE-family HTH domain